MVTEEPELRLSQELRKGRSVRATIHVRGGEKEPRKGVTDLNSLLWIDIGNVDF